MLKDHLLAFDDFLQPTSVQTALRSSDALAGRIAKHDAFVIQAVAEDRGGSPGHLTVYLEHSGDGENWAQKGSTPLINSVALTASGTTSAVGYDTGESPTLNFARLVVSCNGTVPDKVRVRIFMSLRDLDDEAAPSAHHRRKPVKALSPAEVKKKKQEEDGQTAAAKAKVASKIDRAGK